MFVLNQKRTLRSQILMSALTPKTDIGRRVGMSEGRKRFKGRKAHKQQWHLSTTWRATLYGFKVAAV
jgi:hypothetical protein